MTMGKDDNLVLSLSLSSSSSSPPNNHLPLQLNLMIPSSSSASSPSPPLPCHQKTQWRDLLVHSEIRRVFDVCGAAADPRPRPLHRGIDVNQEPPGAAERDSEEDAGASSPNSTLSSASGKRAERGHHLGVDEHDTDRDCSRGISDEEDGEGSRKKLRLSKDQAAILEESFKEHNTLNPVSSFYPLPPPHPLRVVRHQGVRIGVKIVPINSPCLSCATEAKAGVGQAAQPEAKTSGSVVPKPQSKDKVEADRGGLRIPQKVLRDPHRREQEAAEGSARAESSEGVASALHAHDSAHHPHHVPFLRARFQRRHHHHRLHPHARDQHATSDVAAPSVHPSSAVPSSVGADPTPALSQDSSAAFLTEYTWIRA
ncbi:unnamed protein product [Musa hybrid cultivar]